jgi:hypothetical protein
MLKFLHKIYLVFIPLALLYLSSAEILSNRIANYTIDVRLSPATKTLEASETIVWHNITEDSVSLIQLHLYMNAFKGPHTTFIQKRRESGRFGYKSVGSRWGNITLQNISTSDGDELTDDLIFIQPDDENIEDKTVIEVALPRLVEPYDSLVITIDFRVVLPQIVARTGYHNNFFMVGQWFPKLGVYEAGVGWNCHQYHATSEFYADFGVYDVTINVPQEYVVGASGECISEEIHDDSTKSVRYIAKDVHDFAWTADPEFEVISDYFHDIKIRFLFQPEHRKQVDRQLEAIKKSIIFCEEWYGDYPYATLTVIDPPDDAHQAAGMEYPTLITAGFTYDVLSYFNFMEEVAVHEFCHQYFYGILANNEFEEAWLDEGFTTYSEMKIIDAAYNGSINLLNLRFLNREMEWIKFARSDSKKDYIVKNSWEYRSGGYYIFSYTKPALFLLTLENMVGDSVMRLFLKTYYKRYQFRHVTTQDFIDTFCEVAGHQWQPFLRQVLYGTDVLDYRLYSVKNSAYSDSAQVKPYRSEVTVYREGSIICPVEVQTTFVDGTSRTELWDGTERYHIVTYNTSSPVLYAQVDPENKNWLDINRLNNSMRVDPDKKTRTYVHNVLLFWVQNLFSMMSYLL